MKGLMKELSDQRGGGGGMAIFKNEPSQLVLECKLKEK